MKAEGEAAAGLYVHVPFCSAICPYCDFAVVVGGGEKRRRYVDLLLAEIELATELTRGFAHGADTIYFGGGTPTLLTAGELEELLGALHGSFETAAAPHIYLEANPEDVDRRGAEAWRRLGVATLSLGVQSFDDEELRFLGRRHTAAEARRSVETALGAGFDTVSVDLIYGLPDQDPEAWRRNLDQAVEIGPDHLSCYELEVHERTSFGKQRARGELRELGESSQAELFLATHRFLNRAGYGGYEVSNFARGPRHRSRHNRKYWNHTPYLGLGLAAHSFDGERRFWNERALGRYENRLAAGSLPRAGEERITLECRALEELMLGLRTYAGIDLARFRRTYGVGLVETNARRLERWRAEGLVELDGESLRPTVRGLAVADALAAALELDGLAEAGPHSD